MSEYHRLTFDTMSGVEEVRMLPGDVLNISADPGPHLTLQVRGDRHIHVSFISPAPDVVPAEWEITI